MKKLVILAFVLGMCVISCKKKQESQPGASTEADHSSEIVVGVVGSLTGSEATFGISTENAVKMATEELNAAGGINGKKVKIVSLDDQGKPDEAATVITRLITQDKVTAVLGEVASSRSLAMAPIAQQNKIPMISPSSTNPKVTQIGDYVFRVCFIDPFQGYVLAKFATETLKVKKAAILKDIKNDYSLGLAEFFKDTFTKKGGTITAESSYSNGDIDFKAQLTQIRSTKPEFVYLPGYYTDVGLIVRQARELGIKVPFGGGDGWDSEKLAEIGGKALDGSYFSNHYSPDSKDPVLQKFVSGYKAKYGSVPDGLAALGYDAANILYASMKSAKSLSGQDVRDAIAGTKDYAGVTGKITIDANRNAQKSAVVIKIEGGKHVYVETITP
jgi:branched-chain amino acid transport system substrate-binding protein